MVLFRITRPHGLRGEVRAEVRLQDPEVLVGRTVYLGRRPGEGSATRVEAVRGRPPYVVLALSEAQDRAGAESLRGFLGWCRREEAPTLPEGEWYVGDLVGLPVLDRDGAPLGVVLRVEPGVAQDVLVVGGRGHTLAVPFARALVEEIGEAVRLRVGKAFFEAQNAP